ncbi:hypothetical protein Pcinc_017235 [Petrolisthes cinctipes]|uniref:SRA1/Sec31 domain-containing protein n=1 Tax=Petrolisthes cinctipes TaxID=88211 RepID=A0AAE1KQ41_PETCI|nr:hypothetical protein Pcinc_017235 [Petrolisthes cinctipes]
MDPIAPGNHDRAWNDPPKFAFNASSGGGQSGPAGRRRLLNKRVPVPIGPVPPAATSAMRPSDTPPSKSSLPPGPPPTSTTGSFLSHPKKPDINSSNTDNIEDSKTSQEMLQEVELIMNGCVKTLSEKLKENVQEEISRRMAVMKGMWQEEKFSPVVMTKILTMVRALGQGEHDLAWALHQGLIVDYTSLCSPWMVGIKLLITETRNFRSEEFVDETVGKNKDNSEEVNYMNLESSSKEVVGDAVSEGIRVEEPEKLRVADLSITDDGPSDKTG